MQEFDASGASSTHELAVEDAVSAHQRPKLEIYGDTLFLVIKTVRYLGSEELVDVGEVMVFVGADFVITVRHGEAGGLGEVREQLELQRRCSRWAGRRAPRDRRPDRRRLRAGRRRRPRGHRGGRGGGLLAGGRQPGRADLPAPPRGARVRPRGVAPPPRAARADAAGRPEHRPAAVPYFRDVADHAVRVGDQIEGFGTLLTGVLQANLTQVTVRQNEDMRKISAWVAIIAVPTAVAGIYGMNSSTCPSSAGASATGRAAADPRRLRRALRPVPEGRLA